MLASLTASSARGGPDNPREPAEIQQRIALEQQVILGLQQRLIPLRRCGEDDEQGQAEAAALEQEIASHNERLDALVRMLEQFQRQTQAPQTQ